MKKKILGMLCVLSLIICLLPTAAWADTALEDVTFGHVYNVQRDPAIPTNGVTFTASSLGNPWNMTTDEGTWKLTKVGTYSAMNGAGTATQNLTDIVQEFVNAYSAVGTTIDKDTIVIHELTNGTDHIAYGVVAAYDSTDHSTLFVGDKLGSQGAGYLLSVDAITEGSKSIQGIMIATETTTTTPNTYTITFSWAADVQRTPSIPAKDQEVTMDTFKYPLDANGNHGTTYAGTWNLTKIGAYKDFKNTSKDSGVLQSVVNTVATGYSSTADDIIIHELKNGDTHVAYGVVVAYDAATMRAAFIGDNWLTSSGYLLANSVQTSPATMTASTVPTDYAQTQYMISLDKTGTYTFAEATVGYGDQTPVTVTVKNEGTAATGELTVAVVGQDGAKFSLNKTTIDSIAVGSNATFTVVPKTALSEGNYTATVTVSNANLVPQSFGVKFVVKPDTTQTPTTTTGGGGGGNSKSYHSVVVNKVKGGTIEADCTTATKGTVVTVSVTPDDGYAMESLVVTDKNSKEIELTKVDDGKYTFTMPASKVIVKPEFKAVAVDDDKTDDGKADEGAEQSRFVDVPADAYYAKAVLWAAEKGITEGMTATTFAPNAACTRAQMVTFLWRAAGSPEPVGTECPFADVDLNSYYAKAVLWAVEQGITNGETATIFAPDAVCIRAQMVTFIYRVAGGEATGSDGEFSDVAADAYYAEAIAWAVEQGITNGIEEGRFAPERTCTRADMVTFLYRYFAK